MSSMEWEWWNVLMVAVGIVMIGIIMFKWDWYKMWPRARWFIKLVGDAPAKVVYAILAIVLIATGALGAAGVLG